MSMASVRFTVFTPVYNRRHTIHRVFDSLMRQTCKDFEWLVIDDGSTDDLEPLIREYAEKADFPVRYYYKENGGKHTAYNMALGLMQAPYFTILDSDDAFTDDAVEKMLLGWDLIPPQNREQYWGVVGHCIDAQTNALIGEYFPENANDRTEPLQTKGDKTSALRADIAKRFPFPEPEGTTFITESVVWNKIEKEYKQYYINYVFKIVYLNEPDSLTIAWYRDHVQEGYLSNFIWKQSIINDVGLHGVGDLRTLVQYTFYGTMCGKKFSEIVGGLHKPLYRIGSAVLFVPAKLLSLYRKRSNKSKQ